MSAKRTSKSLGVTGMLVAAIGLSPGMNAQAQTISVSESNRMAADLAWERMEEKVGDFSHYMDAAGNHILVRENSGSRGGPEDPRREMERRAMLRQLLADQSWLNFGMSIGYSRLSRGKLEESKSGGDWVNAGYTEDGEVFVTDYFNMSVEAGVRPRFYNRLRVGAAFETLSGKREDEENGGIVIRDGVVADFTGEERTFVKRSDEGLLGLLFSNYSFFAEHDLVVFPRQEGVGVLSAGLFHNSFTTENYVGIATLDGEGGEGKRVSVQGVQATYRHVVDIGAPFVTARFSTDGSLQLRAGMSWNVR